MKEITEGMRTNPPHHQKTRSSFLFHTLRNCKKSWDF